MTAIAGPALRSDPAGLLRRAVGSSTDVWGRRFVWLILLSWAAGLALGFKAALTVLTLVGLASAAWGLYRPFIGLLGVGILCTLDSVSRVFLLTGGLLRWNTFNYWLMLVMLLGLPFLVRLRDAPARLLQAFLLLLFVELVHSPLVAGGELHLINISIFFGLLIYCARVTWVEHAWYWLGVVCGVLGAAGGLVFYVRRSGLGRIDENALGYFWLTAIFAICLGFPYAAARRRGQLLLGMLALCNCLWIFLTGSRGGMLSGLCSLFYLFTELRGLGQRILLAVGGVLLALAVLTQFSSLQDSAVARVEKLLDSSKTAVSRTSGRYDLMVAAWRIFLEHPFGVGTGGFPYYWATLTDREGLSSFRQGQLFASHSAWMKTLVENGIPGICVLAAYVFSFALVGWARRRQGVGVLGLLVTMSLSTAFFVTEFQAKGLWFLAAGATVLLHRHRYAGLVLARPGSGSAPTVLPAGFGRRLAGERPFGSNSR